MKSFNFKTNWNKKVKPILFDQEVQNALNYGMSKWTNDEWESGDAPWKYSRGDYWWCVAKSKPRLYSYKWYQVFHGCFAICYFCEELGKKLYPKLDWKIVKNNRHAVAVGFKNGNPYMIFDILLFEHHSAEEIYDYANPEVSDEEYNNKWCTWDEDLRLWVSKGQ